MQPLFYLKWEKNMYLLLEYLAYLFMSVYRRMLVSFMLLMCIYSFTTQINCNHLSMCWSNRPVLNRHILNRHCTSFTLILKSYCWLLKPWTTLHLHTLLTWCESSQPLSSNPNPNLAGDSQLTVGEWGWSGFSCIDQSYFLCGWIKAESEC